MPPKKAAGVGKEAPSLARLRKERAKGESAARVRVGAGATVVVLAVLVAFRLSQSEPARRLEDHEQYQEALRVLRNDGLEATEQNARFALRLIDAATKPYQDGSLRVVDPRDWHPHCTDLGRPCQDRPVPATVKLLPDGSNVSLLELEETAAKVRILEDLISPAEASVLLRKAHEIDFKTSPTNHAAGQEWRSSSSALVSRDDPAFQPVLRRAAALCGVPLTYLEAPQIVRYRPGERYQPHLDSEGPFHRHWTLLLYLNDPQGGGATAFPLLGFKVNPAPRAAVFWENLRPEPGLQQPVRNYNTLHDGKAPTGTEAKYAVNIWVRNSIYDPGI